MTRVLIDSDHVRGVSRSLYHMAVQLERMAGEMPSERLQESFLNQAEAVRGAAGVVLRRAAELTPGEPGHRPRGRWGEGITVDTARVRQARLDRGLSLSEVAGQDVSRSFIHQVERGVARPSRGVLELIASRTGRSVAWLCGDEEEEAG